MGKKQPEQSKKDQRGCLGRLIWWLIKAGLVVGAFVVLGILGLMGWAKLSASNVSLASLTPGGDSVVLANDGKTVLGHIASDQTGKQLDSDNIPSLIKQAQLAAEDKSFYNHGAIDAYGLGIAMAKDALSMSFDAGGSTIDQQLAKKLVGSEKSLTRKIDELKVANKIESTYTKDDILRMYLNANYYGRGSYGIEDAAQTWFGVSATSLNNVHDPLQVARAAFLASLVQQPGNFEKYNGRPSNLVNADSLWDRVHGVLDQFSQVEKVDPTQMVPPDVIVKAKNLLPLQLTDTVKPTGRVTDGDPYIVAYIHDWMAAWQTENAKILDSSLTDPNDPKAADKADQAGQAAAAGLLARGGLTIQTSLDANLQPMLVNAHKASISPGPSGMIVLNSRDGGVAAVSGGFNYGADPNNYAMYSERPPGSTMKPFVLADAVKHGISPNSVFAAPEAFPGDGPPIQDHTRADAPKCKLTLVQALAKSNNVVYSEAISGKMASCQDRDHTTPIDGYPVNPGEVAQLLQDVGANASLVPGRDSPAKMTAETRLGIGATDYLSPLKLAVMYATLANGGTYLKPHFVDKVTHGDTSLFQFEPESHQVLDPQVAATVNQAMTHVFTEGTAVNDQVKDHPLAGKTGTTDTELADSWMAASNAVSPTASDEPALTFAGWKGQSPTSQGSDVGKVARSFFSHALAGHSRVDFPGADLNAGTHVGLDIPKAPPSAIKTPVTTPSTPDVPTTTEVPVTTTTTTHTTTRVAPPVTTTRSVPPPEGGGGTATGTVTPPTPPGQGGGAVQVVPTTKPSE